MTKCETENLSTNSEIIKVQHTDQRIDDYFDPTDWDSVDDDDDSDDLSSSTIEGMDGIREIILRHYTPRTNYPPVYIDLTDDDTSVSPPQQSIPRIETHQIMEQFLVEIPTLQTTPSPIRMTRAQARRQTQARTQSQSRMQTRAQARIQREEEEAMQREEERASNRTIEGRRRSGVEEEDTRIHTPVMRRVCPGRRLHTRAGGEPYPSGSSENSPQSASTSRQLRSSTQANTTTTTTITTTITTHSQPRRIMTRSRTRQQDS